MTCRHCGVKKANRPRGLCWTCWHMPGVRDLYPSTSKFAVRKGPADFNGVASAPLVATRKRAGSTEKMAVLAERVLAGVSLWHPDDGPEDPELAALGDTVRLSRDMGSRRVLLGKRKRHAVESERDGFTKDD